jgi:PST family polysaccharide transporter
MRVVLWQEWLSLAILMGAIATIGRVDIHWACAAVGIAFIARTLLLMRAIQQLDGIPMRSFLVPLIRPLIACILMAAVIFAARPHLLGLSPAVRLAVEIAVGAAVYLAGALLIFRAAAAEFMGMLRSAISRR